MSQQACCGTTKLFTPYSEAKGDKQSRSIHFHPKVMLTMGLELSATSFPVTDC